MADDAIEPSATWDDLLVLADRVQEREVGWVAPDVAARLAAADARVRALAKGLKTGRLAIVYRGEPLHPGSGHAWMPRAFGAGWTCKHCGQIDRLRGTYCPDRPLDLRSAADRQWRLDQLDDLLARNERNELTRKERDRWSFGADSNPYDHHAVVARERAARIEPNLRRAKDYVLGWLSRNPYENEP